MSDPTPINVFDKAAPSPEQVNLALGKDPHDTIRAVEAAMAAKHGVTKSAPDAQPSSPSSPAEPVKSSDADPATPIEAKKPDRDEEFRKRELRLVEKQQQQSKREKEFDSYRLKTEQELVQARAILEISKRDPFEFFEKYHGIKRDAFLGVPATRQSSTASPEIEAIRQELRAEREERQRERQAQAQAAQNSRIEAAKEALVGKAKASEDKYPTASRWSQERLKARAWEIVAENVPRGIELSDEEILDRIEEELAPLARPKITPVKPAAPTSSQAAPAISPTLTSGGVSETSGPPPNILKMTRQERFRATVAAVEASKRSKAQV